MLCLDKRLLKTLVLAAGIPALVAACGDDSSSMDTPDASTPDAGAPDAGADAGPTGTAIIDQFMEDSIANNRFVGGVVIVHAEGGETFTKTYGVKDIVDNEPMPEDGLFRLVSLGKTIVSVAAMDMLEDELFTLDDPIAMHLPEWAEQTKIVSPDPATPDDPDSFAIVPVDSEITIRHLLTHTSGLEFKFYGSPNYATTLEEAGVKDGLNLQLLADIDGEPATLESFSELLAQQPLLHEPGARWSYGPNLEVMARIMEVVEPDDKPFNQILQERVFDKLGMDDCGFYYEGEDVDRFVPVHMFNPDAGEMIVFPDATLRFPPPDGFWEINPTYPYNADSPKTFFSPSEGLVCSPQDFFTFTRMVLNKGELDGERILEEATVELMTSNQIGDELHAQGNMDYDFGFGFGINTGGSRFNGGQGPAGELDWGGYFNTFFTIDNTNNMITLIFTQTFTGPDFALQLDFKEAAYKATGIIE